MLNARETYSKNRVSKNSRKPSVVFDLQRTSDCAVLLCPRKRTKNEKEALSQDPKCFSPVWAKVLADDRPFGSQKESDSSNSERDTRVNHSFIQSINEPISQPANSIWSRHIPTPGPWAQGLTDATRDPNQTSSTAPTSNAARVRTIVSRCRGRLTFLVRVSSSPDTVLQMGQRQCLLVLRLLRAGAVWPLLRP